MSTSDYTITLRATPGGPPAEVRLRRALKMLLRSFGLRCLEVRAVGSPETGFRDGRPAESDVDAPEACAAGGRDTVPASDGRQ